MGTGTKTRIVRIGNSQGIRIPKVLLDQVDLGEEVELQVQDGHLVIRPSQPARRGWDEQFSRMSESGDDRLLDAQTMSLTSWDADEWEWQ
jgi:antitoxin MazE